MEFTLSFTRTNKYDSMEKDIFTLRVNAKSQPNRLGDFADGTADVSFGYPGVTEKYNVNGEPGADDFIILEINEKTIFKLWQPNGHTLVVGNEVIVTQNDYDRDVSKITRRSW